MVAALHSAGIEVLLDVVYNTPCEGGRTARRELPGTGRAGPTTCQRPARGQMIDIEPAAATAVDAASRPPWPGLVCDSLRYWAELGVDGFRFDAGQRARPGRARRGAFDADSGLLTHIAGRPRAGPSAS